MPVRLNSIHIQNYRSLADVSLELEPVNVLFGPNGAGKSTLLDTIWFVRDCAIRSTELASANRDHGIGLLFDGADESDSIHLKLATDRVEYELTLSLSVGRIEPFAGERLPLSRCFRVEPIMLLLLGFRRLQEGRTISWMRSCRNSLTRPPSR